MCGRYSLAWDTDELARRFTVSIALPRFGPRYNIAPSQQAPIIFDDGESGERRMRLFTWGLVPFWADDPSIGNRMVNARADSVANKPAYRAAARYRRCLVPADGFYEWLDTDGAKQPYRFVPTEQRPIAFAGLYEHWQGEGGEVIDSYTIITTDANKTLAAVHHRMPVILKPESYDRWLDPATQRADAVTDLLTPAREDLLEGYPVSRRVNRPSEDDEGLIEPVETQGSLF